MPMNIASNSDAGGDGHLVNAETNSRWLDAPIGSSAVAAFTAARTAV
jgi:hypothetical protein